MSRHERDARHFVAPAVTRTPAPAPQPAQQPQRPPTATQPQPQGSGRRYRVTGPGSVISAGSCYPPGAEVSLSASDAASLGAAVEPLG